ncbi:Pyoverdine biosynthesis [Niveomyces insectorum RCEF 264]|uniref:Pyoverdine biosynthesis n=1 Tax=Niveomyces insectorum RCEF 264 TaxID=1081102 RepID=A0A167SKE3_9HYPO|nr:Pyoverdine biosynthesis [Niveomyces insectorum RCEF 264]
MPVTQSVQFSTNGVNFLTLGGQTAPSDVHAVHEVSLLSQIHNESPPVLCHTTAAVEPPLNNKNAPSFALVATHMEGLALDGPDAANPLQVTAVGTDPASDKETAPNLSQNGIGKPGVDLDKDNVLPAAEAVKEAAETSSKILSIIFDYALNKFDDTKERLAAGTPKFLSEIDYYVRDGKQLQMCLPAFPFKSANKAYKVLGTLPDKAEELALSRLNAMCVRIGEVYGPGAKLTIISDGLVYNDLLSISDRDTWAYGEALRAMATRKNFVHIDFSRLKDLVDFPVPENLQEVTYVANATNFRRYLLNKYGKDDLNIDDEIATKPDTLMTYRGYRRFLESDLQQIFVTGNGRSTHGYKRDVKYLAKQMLIRGYAFAEAVKTNFPHHLRLSIHQSTGEHKISMSLLNTKTGFTTPWHCSVALMADGEWLSAPMGDFKEDPMLEVVYEDGRPSYFQEKTRKRPYLADTEKKAAKDDAANQ